MADAQHAASSKRSPEFDLFLLLAFAPYSLVTVRVTFKPPRTYSRYCTAIAITTLQIVRDLSNATQRLAFALLAKSAEFGCAVVRGFRATRNLAETFIRFCNGYGMQRARVLSRRRQVQRFRPKFYSSVLFYSVLLYAVSQKRHPRKRSLVLGGLTPTSTSV